MTPVRALHRWDISYTEARKIQETLAARVILKAPDKPVRFIGGADVSFNRFSPTLYAGIVVLTFPGLEPVEAAWAVSQTTFPYVPGYLSFREAPAVLEVIKKLKTLPDILMLDGQGIAHPRGLGLAAHIGLILDLPTIGCAKSLLVGTHTPVGPIKGDSTPLIFGEKEVGRVLRTRNQVKPVFVSRGHLMDVETAAAITLACCPKYRLPEPARRAHRLVNRVRRGETVAPAH